MEVLWTRLRLLDIILKLSAAWNVQPKKICNLQWNHRCSSMIVNDLTEYFIKRKYQNCILRFAEVANAVDATLKMRRDKKKGLNDHENPNGCFLCQQIVQVGWNYELSRFDQITGAKFDRKTLFPQNIVSTREAKLP